MSDFVRRLERHRGSRFGPGPDPLRRRLPLLWLLLGVWGVWVGFVSDHSLWRIWRLSRESAQSKRALAEARTQISKLEAERDDPDLRRLRAERVLRERDGMARKGEIVYRIQAPASDTLAR